MRGRGGRFPEAVRRPAPGSAATRLHRAGSVWSSGSRRLSIASIAISRRRGSGPTADPFPVRRSRSTGAWSSRFAGRTTSRAPLPVVVTVAPEFAVDGVPAQCTPGRSGGRPDPAAAALSGFAVVHLHGGMTQASSDGWTENIAAPGQTMLDAYPNDQRAAMLWYHDHVMGVTRFNVYAGLAGLWIVRDDRERELELPEGPPYEVPLLLSDRNFDLDDDGRLTGDLLHKTDPEVMECFSPFTTVNGTDLAAPRRRADDVPLPPAERLERPHLPARADPRRRSPITIGSPRSAARADCSTRPSRFPARDSCWRPPSEQTSWSTSRISRRNRAHRSGTPPPPPSTAPSPTPRRRPADLDGLLPYPEVLRIRVGEGRRSRRRSRRCSRPTSSGRAATSSASAVVRAIALVEQEAAIDGAPPMLTMRELVLDPGAEDPSSRSSSRSTTATERVTRWRTVATRFEDTTTFFPMLHDPRSGGSSTSPATPIRSTSTSTHSGSSTDTRRRSSSLRRDHDPQARAPPCASARLPRTASHTSSTTTSSA